MIKNNVLKIYVGCSLTHAPEEFKRQVDRLKSILRDIPGVEVLEFLGLSRGDCREVYVHDITDCVNVCDLLIAICDHPAIGLGWEMAVQVEKRRRPLLAIAHCDAKITRLIQDPDVPNYRLVRYKDICVDIPPLVRLLVEANLDMGALPKAA
ncbi:MAG: hypothetical protein WC250_01560 [Candidatus Paceibacterota bacterium]|jgi:hypothetical protein